MTVAQRRRDRPGEGERHARGGQVDGLQPGGEPIDLIVQGVPRRFEPGGGRGGVGERPEAGDRRQLGEGSGGVCRSQRLQPGNDLELPLGRCRARP